MLETVTRDPARAGLLLDFDGTASEIVATPGEAKPREGAAALLSALARRLRVVAVICGRRAREVAAVLGAPPEIQVLASTVWRTARGYATARGGRLRPT